MLDVDTRTRESNNTFKILIATDIHLGYNEKDPIRGNDSFESFEEALQIAQEQNVDFILLGGDLFDANKPTQYTLQRAVNLMKKYTFGDRDITFEVIEDFEEAVLCDTTAEIIQDAIPDINFCDPNLNIAIPVFSIHGNHDDPTGMKSISSLDTLSSMGLVNYIGRQDKLDSLEIKPLMLKKGTSELAIYGVGHLGDRRFARLHRDGKVAFHQVNVETAFQMLVLHQNRANRGTLNYLPYNVIPSFVDLVMWGHEHDCFIEPALTNNIYYSQPGSTVATSLSEGESIPKKVGILYVNEKNFFIEPLHLTRVRPLMFKHVLIDSVEELLSRGISETGLSEFTEKEAISMIRDLLKKAEKERKRNCERFNFDNDKLPLIRLVIHYLDERQSFNDKKVAMLFVDHVANPQDIILQKLIHGNRRDAKKTNHHFDDDYGECGESLDMMDFVKRELERTVTSNICTTNGVFEALSKFVNCSDSYAFNDYIDYRKQKYLRECQTINIENESQEEIEALLEEKLALMREADETEEVRQLLNNPARNEGRDPPDYLMEDMNDASVDDSTGVTDNSVAALLASSTQGKGTRAKGGRGRAGKATKANDSDIVEIDSDDAMSKPMKPKRVGKGRAKGKGK